jgi:hypothetical protein
VSDAHLLAGLALLTPGAQHDNQCTYMMVVSVNMIAARHLNFYKFAGPGNNDAKSRLSMLQR